jgi:uncharacterized protein YcfL
MKLLPYILILSLFSLVGCASLSTITPAQVQSDAATLLSDVQAVDSVVGATATTVTEVKAVIDNKPVTTPTPTPTP